MIVPKVGLGSFVHFLCGLVFPGVVPTGRVDHSGSTVRVGVYARTSFVRMKR